MSAGTLAPVEAEAQSRRGAAVAAGIIGGLAAGAIIGSAVSGAHAAPVYGYRSHGYVPGYRPAYVYDEPHYVTPRYRTRHVVRHYDDYEYAPVRSYRVKQVVRTYDYHHRPRYVSDPYYGW
ncbi:MAG: hypothetical protein ACK4K8_16805 [Pannonibacter sp.]